MDSSKLLPRLDSDLEFHKLHTGGAAPHGERAEDALHKGCLAGSGESGRLTSALAALLHPVLVDVQGEEHVGVAVVVLVAVLLVAPAGGDGGVQEEGGLLRGGCPQLALVLQLEDTS